MYGAVVYRPAGSLAKLLFKNAFLNLITLSIYRFWARTALRRYFWQSVHVDGEPFEYTGLGRELLIGFLIVIAILAPMVLVWHVIEAALNTQPIALVIGKAVYFFIFYLLIMAAGFRARRYRLSRTRWRGMRASQSGSTWHYILLGVGWGVASLATLGLAVPWMRTSMQRYRTTNTWLGDQQFSFDALARPLLVRWLVVLGAAALPIVIFGVMALPFIRELIAAVSKGGQAIQGTIQRSPGTIALLIFLPYIAVSVGFVAYVWYRVGEFRHFTAHTRLGAMAFRSSASSGRIFGRVLLGILACFGCIVAVFAVVIGVFVAFAVAHKAGVGSGLNKGMIPLAVVVGVFVVLALLFVFRLLWTLMVTVGTIRHICETLQVSGLEGLKDVRQSTAAAPRYGEGLADSFDFGAA